MSKHLDEALKDVGLAQEKGPEEKEIIIETSFLETDKYLIEQVFPASSATPPTRATRAKDSHYIQYNRETGTTEEIDQFIDETDQNKIYKPIVDDLLRSGAVILPSGIEEYETNEQLIESIRKFLSTYCEMPSFYEKFIPHLILFYWLYDRFPFIPYLQFVGRTGTGKTTAMEVLGSLCYKPTDASGAITMSSIFRIASKWHGTLLLDEFSASGDNYQEMISFLKSGVSNKAVLRVEGDKVREVKAYLIKSPKMFTSEDPISDAGLQSRTIVLKMEKNKRPVPLYRLKRYEQDACHIRNQLLLFRLRNYDNVDLSNVEYGFEELKFLDGRVQQVITPIYYFSDEKTKSNIIEFAKEQQEETLRERRESLEGQIFQAIFDSYPNEPPLGFVVNSINADRKGQREYTDKKIANLIRKVLGFNIERRGHENIRYIVLNNIEKFAELVKYYGIEKTQENPDLSLARVARENGVADNVKEVEQTISDMDEREQMYLELGDNQDQNE